MVWQTPDNFLDPGQSDFRIEIPLSDDQILMQVPPVGGVYIITWVIGQLYIVYPSTSNISIKKKLTKVIIPL